MTATETLRANLTARGIEYGCLGDYTTMVTHDGVSFMFDDCYDGMLTAQVARLSSDEAIALVADRHGHVAKKNVYCGDGVGHTECTACGRTVSIGSSYCSWCGVRFSGIVSEVR